MISAVSLALAGFAAPAMVLCASNRVAAQVCDVEPIESCFNASGKLTINNSTDDERDSFTLSLGNAPAATPQDFGDPLGTDPYVVCVYDANGVVEELQVAPAGTCDGDPCWKATRKGFQFKDKIGSNDGVNKLTLKASDKGKTQAKVSGKGAALEDPTLSLQAPVAVQLKNVATGYCLGTAFADPATIKKSTAEKFSAKIKTVPTSSKLLKGSDGVTRSLIEPDSRSTAEERGLAPDPNEVYIQSINYGGTGCPSGSVGTSFSNDRSSFTLIFDQFVASSGPSVPLTESRKICLLFINLRIPQGWSYSVSTLDFRGYVSLPKGVTAEQKSTYYFEGEPRPGSASSRFSGPVAKDYLTRDQLGLNTLQWFGCGGARPLIVSAQVELFKTDGRTAQITVDSTDGKLEHVIGLRWKPC
ncbi:MAG TPA: DUF4360 domain-containing protein [Terriglobales bacterium]|nr:DUF4360 domain-containing protein [Terriglobales bacterium]